MDSWFSNWNQREASVQHTHTHTHGSVVRTVGGNRDAGRQRTEPWIGVGWRD